MPETAMAVARTTPCRPVIEDMATRKKQAGHKKRSKYE